MQAFYGLPTGVFFSFFIFRFFLNTAAYSEEKQLSHKLCWVYIFMLNCFFVHKVQNALSFHIGGEYIMEIFSRHRFQWLSLQSFSCIFCCTCSLKRLQVCRSQTPEPFSAYSAQACAAGTAPECPSASQTEPGRFVFATAVMQV